jgi:hypothetical protein
MKFGIVGPISKDRMVLPDGGIVNKLGAVAYTALALAKLLEGTDDCVVCLAHISPKDIKEVCTFLEHPNIILPVSNTRGAHGTRIELHIDRHERVSHQLGTMTPISPAELKQLADCDYLILMPLNEADISLDAIRQFRKISSAAILLDVHGLITGLDINDKRYKKNWEHSEEWLRNINFLKMNDKEAPWAAAGRLLKTSGDYAHYAVAMVRGGLASCWITFGDQSSLIAWRRSDRVFWANVPVVNVAQVIDTVGCGDSASAGFIYSYAKLHNPLLAVVLGNTFGSIKASLSAIQGFPSKPTVRDMVSHNYRDYFHMLLDEFLTQEHLIVHEVKEAQFNENSLHGTDGDGYNYGATHARDSDSQGSSTTPS